MTAAWFGLLITAGVGSVVTAGAAAVLRRDVARLQRAMRPLRVRPDRRPGRSS
jgi:hypothetical protein